MTELRRNPQLGTWVMVSAHRQARPQMPKDWCPFCPGSGRTPDDYDVFLYPNDFPHLMPNPPEPTLAGDALYQTAEAYGQCDVVLYSPDHHGSITQLTPEHLGKLFALWRNHTQAMKRREEVRYCYIFENKGEAIGVTMPHPHGQIYAYPFIPPRIERELETARRYHAEQGSNLFDDIIAREQQDGARLVQESEHFLHSVPFAGDYPYETHLFCKHPRLHLDELTEAEASDFMQHLQSIVKMYDALFGFELPFMMAFHQAPVDSGDYEYYRLHVEFYPPHRGPNVLKYNAGSETGAWAFTNPSSPEEKAAELREVFSRLDR